MGGRGLDKIKLFARLSGCAETAQANERIERRFSRRRIRCQAQFPTSEPISLAITGPTSVTNWCKAQPASWDYGLPVNQFLIGSVHSKVSLLFHLSASVCLQIRECVDYKLLKIRTVSSGKNQLLWHISSPDWSDKMLHAFDILFEGIHPFGEKLIDEV